MSGSVLSLSPLPVVDLNDLRLPDSGFSVSLPDFCREHFSQGNACQRHYEALQAYHGPDKLFLCPYGFSSKIVGNKNGLYSLTAFIPLPRVGGDAERKRAKQYKTNCLTKESLLNIADAFELTLNNYLKVEDRILHRYSTALHEIRKLNQTVKLNAERICREESPDNPDRAPTRLVQIWKTSELMSRQFDIIELLANEKLAEAPCTQRIHIYKIFDKVARIYKKDANNIELVCKPGFRPQMLACDKTFPIIPSVLIENACRYSKKGTAIRVSFEERGKMCMVTVRNIACEGVHLDNRVFRRGHRASILKDGSGNGLYLAQLVAHQHSSRITVATLAVGNEIDCKFQMELPLI